MKDKKNEKTAILGEDEQLAVSLHDQANNILDSLIGTFSYYADGFREYVLKNWAKINEAIKLIEQSIDLKKKYNFPELSIEQSWQVRKEIYNLKNKAGKIPMNEIRNL